MAKRTEQTAMPSSVMRTFTNRTPVGFGTVARMAGVPTEAEPLPRASRFRVGDRHVLRLIKLWLRVPVEERESETGRLPMAQVTAPFLDSTVAALLAMTAVIETIFTSP